ncbi:MAG: EpsI family protein [Puniceicoccales bacterium]|jgi:hypothetical protein|nr:EpsI family protein [Puniceicoccales bacterium]
MSKKLIAFEVCALALTLALAAYIAFFTKATPLVTRSIREMVPMKIQGWDSQTEKLAATEVAGDIVRDVLKFDDYIYRLYHNEKNWVTVYVAYWKPGEVTTTDAGVHNPDSCWVNAGCERIKREFGRELSLGGKKLKPAEYGEYLPPAFNSKNGNRDITRVLFWHLVGGEINAYENQKTGYRSGLWGRIDRLPLIFADIKKYGLNQRREQMFIRLVLPRPLEELQRDKDFVRLVEALRPLGIFEGDSWGTL